MTLVANILIGLVLLIHVYIVLLETVMFRTRGPKVFELLPEQVETMAPAMSNQGCYNGFLVAALALGLWYPDAAIAHAFSVYGLVCIAVAGVWGGLTVKMRILYIQTVPAVLGLIALMLAK